MLIESTVEHIRSDFRGIVVPDFVILPVSLAPGEQWHRDLVRPDSLVASGSAAGDRFGCCTTVWSCTEYWNSAIMPRRQAANCQVICLGACHLPSVRKYPTECEEASGRSPLMLRKIRRAMGLGAGVGTILRW